MTQSPVINSPNNPTGWVCSAASSVIPDHCAKRDLIIADDVYAWLYQHDTVAPNFQHLAEEDVNSINSFPKACRYVAGGWAGLISLLPLLNDLGSANRVQYRLRQVYPDALAMIEQERAMSGCRTG